MRKFCLYFSLVLIVSLIPAFATAWECEVALSGPNTVKLNQTITLSSFGTPEGGSYSWSRTPNLVPNGSTATLTGFEPTFSEYIKVVGYYTTPKGKKCSDTKWIWACLCNITSLTGPAEAVVGQEVTLVAQAEPAGGTYTWTLNTGSGALIPGGSSAVFIGDKAGPVEIKVSYVPPEGGEPCVKYHTIQIQEECTVSLTGEMYQRPVCMAVNFTAEGAPEGGTCSWNAGNEISSNGCSAVYNGSNAGYDTITVTYTTPGDTTCPDSKNILSYSLDGMIPLIKCFDSGTALQHSDFEFFISPSDFTFQPILSPEVVTTNQSQAKVLVTASPFCDSGSTNEASTVVDVVNKDIRTTDKIEFSIPDSFKVPLKIVGAEGEVDLSTSYQNSKFQECCTSGVSTSSTGKTSLTLKLPTAPIPIAGIPLPKQVERFAKAKISLNISGGITCSIKGEYKACEVNPVKWYGEGSLGVGAKLVGGVKGEVPKVIVIAGEAIGATQITEKMVVIDNSKLKITTNWDGLTGKVEGSIIVEKLGLIRSFSESRTYFKKDGLIPVEIDLPNLGNN